MVGVIKAERWVSVWIQPSILQKKLIFSTERCLKCGFVYSQSNGASNWTSAEGHQALWGHHQFHPTRTDVPVLHTPFTHILLLAGFFVRGQFGSWKDMKHGFIYCTAGFRSYKAAVLFITVSTWFCSWSWLLTLQQLLWKLGCWFQTLSLVLRWCDVSNGLWAAGHGSNVWDWVQSHLLSWYWWTSYWKEMWRRSRRNLVTDPLKRQKWSQSVICGLLPDSRL